MAELQYFGTDGIRGKVGTIPITPDFFLKLGWAIGKVMNTNPHNAGVIIGKDTRISGYMFESALQAGLVASGTNILLSGPISTPAIAYLTRTFNACAGIVISASHNDYHDNGIKIFTSEGLKIDTATQHKIEQMIEKPLVTAADAKLGRASRISDAGGRYIEFCKGSIANSISLENFRIVIDCANGATYRTAPKVFAELGAEVIPIGTDPDGFNINQISGSTKPRLAIESVAKFRADFGVVLDGDGDRLVMIDDTGEIANGDDLIYILAQYWHRKGTLGGGVVGTDMTNMGLEIFCQKQGIPFSRVPVGDQHIIAKLKANNWTLGGESSGHILCPHISPAGDGIIAALQVIVALVENKQSLKEAKLGYQRYHQKMTNIECNLSQTKLQPELDKLTTELNKKIGDNARIVIRKSGTENRLRILVESNNTQQVETLSKELEKKINSLLKKKQW